MSRSFELPDVDWATVGTVGEPGSRTFYFQARQADQLVTLKLEKQQVAAMSQFLAEILSDLPSAEDAEPEGSLDLVEPVLAEWAVGALQLAYDSAADRIVILAEEIAGFDEEDLETDPGPESDDPDPEPEPDPDPGPDDPDPEFAKGLEAALAEAAGLAEGDEHAVGRIGITRSQAAAIARRGWELVGSGRPTCTLCGHPIDPEGHSCPRSNGHRPPAP